MSEGEGNRGGGQMDRREKAVPQPRILDIVQIDGRWAQVGPTEDSVKFLDDPKQEQVVVDWQNFRFERFYSSDKSNVPGGSVRLLVEKGMISDDEYMAIHCPGKEERPDYRLEMTVFGIFQTTH